MYGGRCAALTRRPQAGRRLRALLRLTAPSPPRRKSPRRTVRLVAMVLDEVRGDAPVPAAVLDKLEERYLRPIEQAAKLEGLLADPLFLADPINHPALFSDHGPIHVRDVAACYHDLAETANGLLISPRPPERFAFLVAYGLDRKSTRLNSSHVEISYAVFCLKKKKKNLYTHLLKKKKKNINRQQI